MPPPPGQRIRLDDVAGAREHEGLVRVGDDEQGFELTEHLVRAPILGELNGRAAKVAGVLFQFGFEAAEERERVGGGAGEPGEHLVVVEAANLLCGTLHDRGAERDLSVRGHHHAIAAPHADDGGRADTAPLGEVEGVSGDLARL